MRTFHTAHTRLFCFPYAGGNVNAFQQWKPHVPTSLDVYAVELPGHGIRLGEPPFRSMSALVPALTDALAPHLEQPFALFGHSLGAIVAFEFARELNRRGLPGPVWFFASGRRAPQIPSRRPPVHQLPDPDLITELRRLQGTPPAVLEHAELMEVLLPIIRADFQLSENYVPSPGLPLNLPIKAFCGSADSDATLEDANGWAVQTTRFAGSTIFQGDHFFLNQHAPAMLQLIEGALRREG